MNARNLFPYIVCIAASLAAGFIGSFATMESVTTWYATITQPSWTPPNWLFGPVWTLLYILMGSSAALVWNASRGEKKWLMSLFFSHLVVNALWSLVFFGAHNVAFALGIIAVLWFMIVVMMIVFWRYSRTATYLLAPYLLWVSYASTINLGVLLLN